MGRPNTETGRLEDHKGFGELHPQFWGRELPLLTSALIMACDMSEAPSDSI